MRPFQPVRGSNGRQRVRNASVDGRSERFVEMTLDRGGTALGIDRDDLGSRGGGGARRCARSCSPTYSD